MAVQVVGTMVWDWLSQLWPWMASTHTQEMVNASITESVLFPLKQGKWGGNQLCQDRIQFLGLTGSPYRSLLRIQYGASIICKRVEKACSLLLQMKHSGETLLYRSQIKSLDFNTNKIGRVLVSIPQQIRNEHSTAVWFQKLHSTRQHHRHIHFGHEKVIVFKMVFSFLNFLVSEASTCLLKGGRVTKSHPLFMIKQPSGQVCA